MKLADYCTDLNILDESKNIQPWEFLLELEDHIEEQLVSLGNEYKKIQGVAIHKSAVVEPTATINAPAIIGPGCFIGSHSLIRGGVILGEGVSIGPSCEVKHSIVGKRTSFAHFNFVGDSIIGSEVNLEAGAVIANHFNERDDKTIYVLANGAKTDIGLTKFGAIIGDKVKIGANAVTSPGTLLPIGSVVGRLELVEQIK